jgi:methyl-accepting chemotaxis protein
MKKIYVFFLKKYSDNDYRIQQKIKALVSISGFIFLLLFLLNSVYIFSAGRGIGNFAVLSIFAVQIILLVSLLLLKAGYYRIASHILLIIVMAAVWTTYFSGAQKDMMTKMNSINYLFPSIILVAILTSKLWVIIYTIINSILIVVVGQYYFMQNKLESFQVIDFTIDGLVTFIISGGCCVAFSYLSDSSHKKIQHTLEENINHSNNISEILKQANDIAAKLAASTEELTSVTESFSSNSQNQASSVEEITSTVEEVSAGSESVHDMAEHQVSLTEKVRNEMEQTYAVVENAIKHMRDAVTVRGELNSMIEKSKTEIQEALNVMQSAITRFKNVQDTVEIIKNISDQINLLSLNAAIEAARAGDQGKGFAVVADEIGKLADNTSSNVKSINDLFSGSYAEINKAYKTMELFIETLNKMISHISGFSKLLDIIADTTTEDLALNQRTRNSLGDVIGEANSILSAIHEQKTAFEEVSKGLTSINNAAQHTAAGSEELLGTSREVADSAQQLIALSNLAKQN